LSFPALILTLVVAENLGPSESHVIFAIAYFQVPAVGRLARANTLRLRELEFISVAKLSGTSDFKILLRHIAPNIIPQLMTFAFLGVSIAIIVEASLSFLGFGVPPPNPSWGNMIALGQQYLATEPALIFVPAAFLFVTVASLNMVGDALRLRWVQA
jgi:peptide/nickel transport system permease protein